MEHTIIIIFPHKSYPIRNLNERVLIRLNNQTYEKYINKKTPPPTLLN
jgi:hypothetical protein